MHWKAGRQLIPRSSRSGPLGRGRLVRCQCATGGRRSGAGLGRRVKPCSQRNAIVVSLVLLILIVVFRGRFHVRVRARRSARVLEGPWSSANGRAHGKVLGHAACDPVPALKIHRKHHHAKVSMRAIRVGSWKKLEDPLALGGAGNVLGFELDRVAGVAVCDGRQRDVVDQNDTDA